jgi:hypothetical protein
MNTHTHDIIKMELTKLGWKCVHWINMARDKNEWRALVNTLITRLIHKGGTAGQRLVSQEGLCSLEFFLPPVAPSGA